MKALIQRVSQASVVVDDKVVSSIGQGIVCLLGIGRDDGEKEADWLMNKVTNARLWDNPENGKPWGGSVGSLQLEALVVSQFTLYGSLKGNKPDFHRAMKGEHANELYEYFMSEMRAKLGAEKVKGGVFGAHMQVSLVNDGPVTLEITSDGVNVPAKKQNRHSNSSTPKETASKEATPKEMPVPSPALEQLDLNKKTEEVVIIPADNE